MLVYFRCRFYTNTMKYTILLRSAIIYRVCLLGIFDFERILKSVLRLLSTTRTKIRIGISVQHQNACSVAGQRIISIEGYI